MRKTSIDPKSRKEARRSAVVGMILLRNGFTLLASRIRVLNKTGYRP